MSDYLKRWEREKKLEKIRGKAKGGKAKAGAPGTFRRYGVAIDRAWSPLDLDVRRRVEDQHGPYGFVLLERDGSPILERYADSAALLFGNEYDALTDAWREGFPDAQLWLVNVKRGTGKRVEWTCRGQGYRTDKRPPQINQPGYKHYVVAMRYPKGSVPESDNYPVRILSGWDFREDAQDGKADEPDGGRDLKIRSGTYLRSRRGGLDPDDNASWTQ